MTPKELWLAVPETMLDHEMLPLIEKWDDEPNAAQILEVLDNVIYGALAPGFTVAALQEMYTQALHREETTHEAVVEKATWREALQG